MAQSAVHSSLKVVERPQAAVMVAQAPILALVEEKAMVVVASARRSRVST